MVTLFIPHRYNVKDYPSDSHSVKFNLESWSYNKQYINIGLANDRVNMDLFVNPSEFNVIYAGSNKVNNSYYGTDNT